MLKEVNADVDNVVRIYGQGDPNIVTSDRKSRLLVATTKNIKAGYGNGRGQRSKRHNSQWLRVRL